MVSSRSFLFALAVIACTAVTAKPLIRRHRQPQVTLSSLVGDLICPKGMQVFQVNNDATVPNIPPYKVWKYAGNFFNVGWQGLDPIATSGMDNTPGAIRTFTTLGLTLQEKLNFNLGSTKPTPYQTYFYQQFTLLGQPSIAGAQVANVQDFFSVSAKGADTYMNWQLVGCSNATVLAQSIFSKVHDGALAGTASFFDN